MQKIGCYIINYLHLQMMIDWRGLEFAATFLNIGANIAMLMCMLHDSQQRVPAKVIYMQMSANVSWAASATLRGDPYILVTAASSLIVQTTTALVLVKTRRQNVKLSNSLDELPSFAPLSRP